MRKWIDVKTALPELNKEVLVWTVYDNKPHVNIGYLRYGPHSVMINPYGLPQGKDCREEWNIMGVTHWMPLPESPNEEENNG